MAVSEKCKNSKNINVLTHVACAFFFEVKNHAAEEHFRKNHTKQTFFCFRNSNFKFFFPHQKLSLTSKEKCFDHVIYCRLLVIN